MTKQNTTALPYIIGFTSPKGVGCPQFESVGSAWHKILHKKRGSLTVSGENLFASVGHCYNQVEICWADRRWWWAWMGTHNLLFKLFRFSQCIAFYVSFDHQVLKYFHQINVK